MPAFTYICSPFRGKTGSHAEVTENSRYARYALRDSLMRGEAPVATHLMYPQVLVDDDPSEREIAMKAALELIVYCDRFAVYTDRGVSAGMEREISMALDMSKLIEERQIFEYYPIIEPEEISDGNNNTDGQPDTRHLEDAGPDAT